MLLLFDYQDFGVVGNDVGEIIRDTNFGSNKGVAETGDVKLFDLPTEVRKPHDGSQVAWSNWLYAGKVDKFDAK